LNEGNIRKGTMQKVNRKKMNDREKLNAIKEVQKNLHYLAAAEELVKQCRLELLQLSKKYRLIIDFQGCQVTDWGDLKGE
jgi:hypothetical protein